MKRDNGLSIVALIITIVILLVVAVFAYIKIFGENGILRKYNESETEYNKEEIVEKINTIVKQKYIFDTKYCSENNKKLEEFYNTEYIIQYLKDNEVIEELKDINDNIVVDQYYINPNKLNGDLATNVINENGSDSNGTKVFKLKKVENEDKYKIWFVDKYGEEEELGELIVTPET